MYVKLKSKRYYKFFVVVVAVVVHKNVLSFYCF